MKNPAKRSKTQTKHKDLQRGDSWELLKAEKIRCAELESHKTNSSKRDAELELHQQACMKRDLLVRKNLGKKRKDQEDGGSKSIKRLGKRKGPTSMNENEENIGTL